MNLFFFVVSKQFLGASFFLNYVKPSVQAWFYLGYFLGFEYMLQRNAAQVKTGRLMKMKRAKTQRNQLNKPHIIGWFTSRCRWSFGSMVITGLRLRMTTTPEWSIVIGCKQCFFTLFCGKILPACRKNCTRKARGLYQSTYTLYRSLQFTSRVKCHMVPHRDHITATSGGQRGGKTTTRFARWENNKHFPCVSHSPSSVLLPLVSALRCDHASVRTISPNSVTRSIESASQDFNGSASDEPDRSLVGFLPTS